MYTDATIQAVKSAAEIVDVVSDFIELKREGSNLVSTCPFPEHNEKTPSFKVSKSKQIYKCFGCGKSGDAIQWLIDYDKKTYTEAIEWLASKYHINLDTIDGGPKVYAKPTWKNNTDLNERVVKWFEGRGISQRTLKEMRISQGMEWMPQTQSDRNVMEFNYFRDDVLINTKYRDSKKNFKLHKNSELIFYNLDCLKLYDEVYIVEGEMDALSLVEAGIKNVISVPNGASKDTNNLQYIDNCFEEFKSIQKIHLALDNDVNGRKLREDIAERFGKNKCDYITFLDCKDANECLQRYGSQTLTDSCVNKIEFPLEGVFTISHFSNEIDDMYVNGLDRGIDVELEGFDCRLVKGYIYTFTGIPSHGKSDFVDEITLRAIIKHGWKGAFYSPENKPTQLHFSKMARKIVGKHWDGKYKMSEEEKNVVKNYLEKKVWFVKPEKDFTLGTMLEKIRDLKTRYGLDFFVIDAWNKIDHKGDHTTDHVGIALDLIATFCEANNLLCLLVAHPTKIEKEKKPGGKYFVPTLYNINGSSNFYNKTDAGFCAYRDFDTNETRIYRQKLKFDHWGVEGYSVYKYDIPSKRYYADGCFDSTNWITREKNESIYQNPTVEEEMSDENFDF